MENNNNMLGQMVPWPLRDISIPIPPKECFNLYRKFDFYKDWLVPQLKSRKIYTQKKDCFSLYEYYKSLKENFEVDTYLFDGFPHGALGVSDEGIFGIIINFFAVDYWAGSDGLMRKIIYESQNQILGWLLYSGGNNGIFDLLYVIYIFNFDLLQENIEPLIEQSNWIFRNLGIGYIAYQLPSPTEERLIVKIKKLNEPSKIENNFLGLSTEKIKKLNKLKILGKELYDKIYGIY